MSSAARVVIALLCLALPLGACAGTEAPTGVPEGQSRVGLAIQPALIPSPADGTAAPIDLIRAVTIRVSDDVVLDVTEVDVSPTADSWEIVLRIPASDDETVVVVSLYLINSGDGGPESVEFSGRSEPITIVAGEESSPDIPFVRGPIANLFVTGITITSAPATMAVGSSQALSAQATSSDPGEPTVFWTSLDPGIITAAGSTATAVAAGTARLVASAGAFAEMVSVVVYPVLTVTTTSLPGGVEGVDYGTQSLQAAGGDGSYIWALATGSGPLPAGLSLASNGDITGTPTVAGTSSFTVEVTSGTQSAQQALSITVQPTLAVTTTSLPDGVENVDYGVQSLQATGGVGSYTWALATGSGPLPAGLSLAPNGDITGTPTVAGTSSFTVEVTSGTQTAQQALSITVRPRLAVSTTSLPDGVEDVDYGTQSLQATGGDGTYAWALAAGSGPLPTGLGLASNGDITGTPTVAGVSSFTVEVTSGDGQTATQPLGITVQAAPVAPVISNLTLPLIQLNHPNCENLGSVFEVTFDFTDVNGDVSVNGSTVSWSFTGQPSGTFFPDPFVPSLILTGTSSAGTLAFGVCHAFGADTSVDVAVSLTDDGGLTSNSLTASFAKPGGANVGPPSGSPARVPAASLPAATSNQQ